MDVTPNSAATSPLAPAATPAAGQSPATPETDELRRRILERILESSDAVPPPSIWRRFGSSKSVRRLTCEPSDLLSRLCLQFSLDELLAARVAVRTQAGELEVSSVLENGKAFIVRGDAAGHARDIVGHRGKLSTGTPEWRELTAETTDQNSAHEKPVVLGASDADLYALVRLGIRCTPMAGVDQLTEKQVRALFRRSPRHAQQRRRQMVLLGWQPDTLSTQPSAQNLAAIHHISAIREMYSVDPYPTFGVWMPTSAELVKFRRANSFVDRNMLNDLFNSSLQESLLAPADAVMLLADRRPETWAKARAALDSVVERSIRMPDIGAANAALEKLERAFCRQVVRPLEAAGNRTGLPALRSLMAADLAELWYHGLELIRAAERLIAGQYPGHARRIDDAELNHKLRIVSGFVKLARLKFDE